MASIYGKGIVPFYSPGTAQSSPDAAEVKLPSLNPVAHNWGVVQPHHFDFKSGLEVRRDHPDLRSEVLHAVRLTGAGILRQDGQDDQSFKGGAILVQRSLVGAVRAFSPAAFLKNFQHADGERLLMAEEVPFQTPDRKEKDAGVGRRRAA